MGVGGGDGGRMVGGGGGAEDRQLNNTLKSKRQVHSLKVPMVSQSRACTHTHTHTLSL